MILIVLYRLACMWLRVRGMDEGGGASYILRPLRSLKCKISQFSLPLFPQRGSSSHSAVFIFILVDFLPT